LGISGQLRGTDGEVSVVVNHIRELILFCPNPANPAWAFRIAVRLSARFLLRTGVKGQRGKGRTAIGHHDLIRLRRRFRPTLNNSATMDCRVD
jgi:hypothetical protein